MYNGLIQNQKEKSFSIQRVKKYYATIVASNSKLQCCLLGLYVREFLNMLIDKLVCIYHRHQLFIELV